MITAEKGTCPSGLSATNAAIPVRLKRTPRRRRFARNQRSEAVIKANEEFLAQKKAHKLKRAGRRHKSKGHKKRKRAESAGSAAGLAFRSPRATRRKRSTKKRRRSGWSVSRKVRSKKAHADNGNGLSSNKLGLVIAAFLDPVVRKVHIEIKEIVETSSEAFQVVIAEGGEEVASFVETGFSIGKVVLAGGYLEK